MSDKEELRVDIDDLRIYFPKAIGDWKPVESPPVNEGQLGVVVRSTNPSCHIMIRSYSREEFGIGTENPLRDIQRTILLDYQRMLQESSPQTRLDADLYAVTINDISAAAIIVNTVVGAVVETDGTQMQLSVVTKESDGTLTGVKLRAEQEPSSPLPQSETLQTAALFSTMCGLVFVLDEQRVISVVVQSDYYKIPGYHTTDPARIILPDRTDLSAASKGVTETIADFLQGLMIDTAEN